MGDGTTTIEYKKPSASCWGYDEALKGMAWQILATSERDVTRGLETYNYIIE